MRRRQRFAEIAAADLAREVWRRSPGLRGDEPIAVVNFAELDGPAVMSERQAEVAATVIAERKRGRPKKAPVT